MVNINKHLFQLQSIKILPKNPEKTYFVFAILGVCLLLKVLYDAQECKTLWSNYESNRKPIETIKIHIYKKVETLFTAICKMGVASRIYEKQNFQVFDFLDRNS